MRQPARLNDRGRSTAACNGDGGGGARSTVAYGGDGDDEHGRRTRLEKERKR